MEGFWRAHQIPIPDVECNPAHLALLEHWMRSYKPEELFDANRQADSGAGGLAPAGARRMSANKHANGGFCGKTSICRTFALTPSRWPSQESSKRDPRSCWENFSGM